MTKKDLLIALCKKNDYYFEEVPFIDVTKGEYFQIVFSSPDEDSIRSMTDVNKLTDFIELLIDDAEKNYKKRFNERILMIEDSLLVFGEWKQLEKV